MPELNKLIDKIYKIPLTKITNFRFKLRISKNMLFYLKFAKTSFKICKLQK